MSGESQTYVIGVVSDTHGSLNSWVLDAFEEVDGIVHAGDICDGDTVKNLSRMAPVTYVHGNMDAYDPTRKNAMTRLGGCTFYVLHDLLDLDLDPAAAGIQAVIHGHTHRAAIEWRRGVLVFNPGSASRPRGSAPESVGFIRICDNVLQPEIFYRP